MPSEFRPVDAGQVMGNYLGARATARQGQRQDAGERRNVLRFQTEQRQAENVFADRERKLVQEEEDRGYLKRRRKIEGDKEIKSQMNDLIAKVDTSADDETFQEQISQIPDALGNRMSSMGYQPQDINRTVQDLFNAGALTRPTIKRLQKKMGVGPATPRTSATYADLEAMLGRKPTMDEMKEYKKGEGAGGQMPSDAKMVEYLVANEIAPDRKNAYSMVQMSKSDPVKLVSSLVKASEDAQKSAALLPGDPEYKDRQTLIKEAQQTVMDIRKAFTSGGQEEAAQYTPQHVVGGADPRGASPDGGQPPAPAGNEPVPQTQADFDALAPGTTYRDPDDGQLYRK